MPSPITINIDTSRAVESVRVARRQIPFITAQTLSQTARDARDATRTSLKSKSRFTLRNTWTETSIFFKGAQKNDLRAQVYTDFSRRANATDYLALQDQASYVKYAQHQFLCIPTDALYGLCGGRTAIIPDALRPTALLNYCDRQFEYEVSKGRNKGQMRGAGRGPAVRGWVFFNSYRSTGQRVMLTTKSGAHGIWGRPAGARNAYLLYVLVHHTKSVRGRFHMEAVVREVVNANWRKHWDENWTNAFAKGVRL